MQEIMKKLVAGLEWKKFEFGKHQDWNDMPSKETEEQIRVGAVLKLKDGSFELVGSVNKLLGVCDDCVNFGLEDIAEIAYLI